MRFPTVVSRSCAAAAFLAACSGDTDKPSGERVTLPDGTVLMLYRNLDSAREDTVVTDLRIGSVDGADAETFGDIRGIEVGGDGRIHVLDHQAAEVRQFAADGQYLATLTHRGDGPAELSRANGMVFDTTGTLWVQDHAKRAILGLSPDGTELARIAMIVPGYGYFWSVTVDDQNVFWQTWNHSPPRAAAEPEPGRQTGAYQRFYKSFDPVAPAYDSVFLGDATTHTYVVKMANGWSVLGLPFAPGPLAAIDRAGRIWTATSDAYRLARLDGSGDTTLVLQIDERGPIITAEERDGWLDGMDRFQEESSRLKAELGGLFPERKPVLEQLVIDDENRLWVRRSVSTGQLPRFDVFDSDAGHVGSVRLPADMYVAFPPVIRDGRIYFIVRDSLDVQYVVGAAVPGGR
jgi:hypothetical protein